MRGKKFNKEKFSNKNILCDECEKAVVIGLKSNWGSLYCCIDCVITNMLIRAMMRLKNMIKKDEVRGAK